MTPATLAWLSAFLFTQAVEVPVYVAALRRADERGDGTPIEGLVPQLAVAFGASLITHPIVWFVIPHLPFRSYAAMVAGAETFAVLVEGVYLYALDLLPLRRALLWSLAANGASVTLGLTSRYVFGWP